MDCWFPFLGAQGLSNHSAFPDATKGGTAIYFRAPCMGCVSVGCDANSGPNLSYMGGPMVYIKVSGGNLNWTTTASDAAQFTLHRCQGSDTDFFLTYGSDAVMSSGNGMSSNTYAKSSGWDTKWQNVCPTSKGAWGLFRALAADAKWVDEHGRATNVIQAVNGGAAYWSGFNNNATINTTYRKDWSAGLQWSQVKPS